MYTFMGYPAYLDFEGQKLATRLYTNIIMFFAAVGFVVGYYVQSFQLTLLILGIGVILAFLVVVPPWPMYRRNPLEW